MQIERLQNFIKAYEKAYKVEFDSSFKGKISALCKELDEPFMHLSPRLKTLLHDLQNSLDRNIQVGIIGQFSSGKSSLLNLILKRPCLPTGAVPVTFKPTFLHYGKEYFLRVEFNDGSDLITHLEELENYTDQRKSIKEAKKLHIYAPVPLLSKLTLVDTPGLNANENDSLTTFGELENLHSVIWLSLIDNAGKKSEEDAIRANLELLGDSSLCILNQKDKVSPEELERVLGYARGVFSGYFKDVIALSCKEAAQGQLEKSNLHALIKHLQGLNFEQIKQNFVRKKMHKYCQSIREENQIFIEAFELLEERFTNYEGYLGQHFEAILHKSTLLGHEILTQLKGIAGRISTELFGHIKEKECAFYRKAKGLFQKNLYQKYPYKAPFISGDDAFLALFYHSELLRKEFQKIKRDFENSFENLKQDLRAGFERLQREILLFKARFSNIQKDSPLQSEANFAHLRAFASASEEHFLRDFENALLKSTLELELFFEKLKSKTLSNYENAAKLSLAFFERKMNESRALYELDSTEFALFTPQKTELDERLLSELCVYEFENFLINKPLINKIIKNLLEKNLSLCAQKKSLIATKRDEIQKRVSRVLDIEKKVECL